MALTGILRPAFIQIRVLDLREATEFYTKRIGLHQVCEGPDGRVYLKAADEFDHHSLVLRHAESAGVDIMCFKVLSDADLNFSRSGSLTMASGSTTCRPASSPASAAASAGRCPPAIASNCWLTPKCRNPHPKQHNPHIWEIEPHGMAARRFDHALLFGPDLEKNLDFFTRVLDFRCAERIDLPDGPLAVWLSCGTKAHDIAFARHPEPGKLHHVAFDLENWQAVGHAADLMTLYDISLDIGPTRHGITRGQTIYFFDPSGNRCEVFAGGYTYYPDNPTRTWDQNDAGKGIFYYERQINEAFLTVLT